MPSERTTKVRMLRPCFAGGVMRRVGELVELPAEEALALYALAKAEPVARLAVRRRESDHLTP
jgi:hypothetical protein